MSIRLTSISIAQAATNVVVNAPAVDLTNAVQYGYELIVEGLSLPLTIVSGGNGTLEIAPEDAPASAVTNAAAKIIRTKGALQSAIEKLEAATTVLSGVKDGVSAAATPDSVVKRTSGGQVIGAAPTADNHLVNRGYLGDAATRDVVTSTTDVTDGRVIRIFGGGEGWMGLGGGCIDFDQVVPPAYNGFFSADYEVTGVGGIGSANHSILQWGNGNSRRTQLIVPGSGDAKLDIHVKQYDSNSNVVGIAEMFHTENLNIREYGVNATDDFVTDRVWARTGDEAFAYFDNLTHEVPTNIQVEGTFKLVDDQNNIAAVGIDASDISLGSRTSQRVVQLFIQNLTDVEAGKHYTLRAGSASRIEIN